MAKQKIISVAVGLLVLIFFSLNLINFSSSKRDWRNVVKQVNSYSCGYCCLKMIFNYYSLDVDSKIMSNFLLKDRSGTSFLKMKLYSKRYRLKASGLHIEYNNLSKQKKPLILFINNSHFIVLDSIVAGTHYIRDPLRGNIHLTEKRLKDEWKGDILVFEKK